MDSFIMDKLKAMNRPEKETSEAEGTFLENILKLERILKEMGGLTAETKMTLDSSAAVPMSVNIFLSQKKALAEKTNGLYGQMIEADKNGIKKSKKTYLKGVLLGVLAGMTAWLVIAVLVVK